MMEKEGANFGVVELIRQTYGIEEVGAGALGVAASMFDPFVFVQTAQTSRHIKMEEIRKLGSELERDLLPVSLLVEHPGSGAHMAVVARSWPESMERKVSFPKRKWPPALLVALHFTHRWKPLEGQNGSILSQKGKRKEAQE